MDKIESESENWDFFFKQHEPCQFVKFSKGCREIEIIKRIYNMATSDFRK